MLKRGARGYLQVGYNLARQVINVKKIVTNKHSSFEAVNDDYSAF